MYRNIMAKKKNVSKAVDHEIMNITLMQSSAPANDTHML